MNHWFALVRSIRDVWVLWLVLAIVTALPYAIASLRAPEGTVFAGVLSAYDDTFTYFAWMRQSADGHLLSCDLFTSEPQSCELFLPLWVALGWVARITRAPLALTFHSARVLATLLLLMVARAVAGPVIKSRRRRQFTLWIYAMSGGLGWLVYALNNRSNLFAGDTTGSIDLTIPEAIAFRSVFAQVHFVVGTALLCGSIHLCFGAVAERKTSRAAAAGLLLSLLAVVHPYMVVVGFVVAFACLLTRPLLTARTIGPPQSLQTTRAAATFCVAMIPGAAYLFYLDKSNWVSREWLRVTDTLSPAPLEYASGFGFVAILAVLGFRLMWKTRPYGRLLLVWCLAQAALLYSPVSFQRRLVEGVQLPLSIAASVAVLYISNRILRRHRKYRSAFLICVVALLSLTNLGFIAGEIAVAASRAAIDPRRYVSADLIESFQWLRANSEPGAVLFTSYLTGNLAPSMTGRRVFLGHYGQTARSGEKGANVTEFYSGKLNDIEARELFNDHNVRYVIYGPFERAISENFAPPRWLRLAHHAGDVQVYEVANESAFRFR